MPRNPGTGVYTQPAPDVVSGTTIESKVYNDFVNDVELDLNTARPIVAGGTGGDDAAEARANLKTEVAMAQVTDYGTQVWESGSFYSLTSATAPPVAGHAFFGFAQVQDANNIVLEARDESDTVFPGRVYVREKKAGTWVNGGAWTVDQSSDFVKKVGDTMTGGLTIKPTSAAWPVLTLDRDVVGKASVILGALGGVNRWQIYLGTADSGSDFGVLRCDDTGTILNTSFGINRIDSAAIFSGASLTITYFPAPAQGILKFGNTGTKYLNYDGTVFNFVGGQLNVTSSIVSAISATTGTYYFGSSGTKYLNYDGNSFTFAGGAIFLGTGFVGRPGVAAGAYSGTVHNFNWTGSLQAWVDTTNVGNVTLTSDYRTKKDVEDLHGTWDVVKDLRPIKYTQADYTPEGSEAMFVADDVERWGFVAHELQDTLIESAATGYKDAPDYVQSPNPWTVIAALTKALQEAMTRIEALEARQ